MSDDLSNLFARQMVVANPAPIVYSITQHYHHSAHRAPVAVERPRSEPAPVRVPSAEDILTSNGVDPASLFPSQITLFKQADDDQKRRLIELWQIAPPEYGNHALAQDLETWPPTSMDREVEMAKLRYDRLHQAAKNQQMHAYQQHVSEPDQQQAEPYVVSGYEMLAQREYEQQRNLNTYSPLGSAVGGYKQATDPAYMDNDWWVRSQQQQQQPLEHQYGSFQQQMDQEMN